MPACSMPGWREKSIEECVEEGGAARGRRIPLGGQSEANAQYAVGVEPAIGKVHREKRVAHEARGHEQQGRERGLDRHQRRARASQTTHRARSAAS